MKRILAIVSMNCRSMRARAGASLVIVIGIACVVGVLISVLGIAVGLEKTLTSTARADRAIILTRDASSENTSSLSREEVQAIRSAPGVKHGNDGEPIESAEVLTTINVEDKSDHSLSSIGLRGVSPTFALVRPELSIVHGRLFKRGRSELIVGEAAARQYAGLAVGDTLSVNGAKWQIVGIFKSGGDGHESELFADADTVLSMLGRSRFSSVIAVLDSSQSFAAFKAALAANPSVNIEAKPESQFYSERSEVAGRLLRFTAYAVSAMMALGACLGALNAMYSSVSDRVKEIGTLRAIGFGSGTIVVSLLLETLILAVIGAILGTAFAWLLFSGHVSSAIAGADVVGVSQVAVQFQVSIGLMMVGVAWALTIGFLGALAPAIRAVRLPIATALGSVT